MAFGAALGEVAGGALAAKARTAALASDDPLLAEIFCHELVLCPTRYVLVCSAAVLESVLRQGLGVLCERLAASDDAALVELSAPPAREGAPPMALLDLSKLAPPFETLPGELMRTLERCPRLAAPARPRAVVLDPGLIRATGHHAMVARAQLRGMAERGFMPVAVVARASEMQRLDGAVEFRRGLSAYLYGSVADAGLFERELAAEIGALGIVAEDVLFAFCATPAMLAGLVLWQLKRLPGRRPRVFVRFDRPEWLTPPAGITYRELFADIARFGLAGRFRFFVESVGLQRYYEIESGKRFPILFNLVPGVAAEDATARLLGSEPAAAAGGPLNIAYLGECREEKGFHFLPNLVRMLLDDPKLAGRIRFTIQVGSNDWNDTPPIALARTQLQQLARSAPERLTLVPGGISEAAYAELIRRAGLILLPYDPRQYRIRGSGIATEAAAAGIPFVVSCGMDAAATYAGTGVVESDEYSAVGFVRATRWAIEHIDALRLAAQEWLDTPQSRRSVSRTPRGFMRRLLEAAGPEGAEAAPSRIVLWISNDTRGEGSGKVYDSQLAYLRDRGYAVLQIVVPYPAAWRAQPQAAFDPAEFLRRKEWTFAFRDSAEFHGVLERIRRDGHSAAAFMAAWQHLAVPPGLLALLRHMQFAFAVVNYAHHLPVARLLAGADTKLLLEAHDIQAHQYALQRGREVDPAELAAERALVAAYRHVFSISHREMEFFAAARSPREVTWCMPFIDIQAPAADSEAGGREYDMIFVGSAHDANLESLRWFLAEVFTVFLWPEGLTLLIVGSAGEKIEADRFQGAVQVAGRVPDIAPFYDRAALAVLPIVAGAGVPIKVLDAFARGMPFVVSDFPAEAMQFDASIPTAASAWDMAEQILRCLRDPAERARRRAAALAFVAARASRDSFYARWDAAIAALAAPAPAVAAAPALEVAA